MLDLEKLNQQLTDAVKDAVRAEAHRLQGTVALTDAIVSVLRKPVLTYPDDVGLVLGTGRTTTFSLADEPGFPPRIEIGRRRFVSTQKFMDWVASREVAA